MKKTYEQGAHDVVQAWAEICGAGNCEECPVYVVTDAGVDCAEFARKFPAKFAALMLESAGGGVSYAQEYALRFPQSGFTSEELASLGICRKMIFSGVVDCDRDASECKGCWEERYEGDSDEDFTRMDG